MTSDWSTPVIGDLVAIVPQGRKWIDFSTSIEIDSDGFWERIRSTWPVIIENSSVVIVVAREKDWNDGMTFMVVHPMSVGWVFFRAAPTVLEAAPAL